MNLPNQFYTIEVNLIQVEKAPMRWKAIKSHNLGAFKSIAEALKIFEQVEGLDLDTTNLFSDREKVLE